MNDDNDLKRAWAELAAKHLRMTTLWRYYDGDHPLVYSRAKLRELFSDLDADFTENWCGVVVDSVAERVSLTGWIVDGDEAASERLGELWRDTGMTLDDDEAHLAALVTGESYLIGWRRESGAVEAYYNDPRLIYAHYDPDNPRALLWAAKWWVDDEERRSLMLYYPERLVYYRSKGKAQDATSHKALVLEEEQPNPFGRVPIFHLRRTTRGAISEMANAIRPQDAINKLLADMMIVSEAGAFKQRYIITQADLGDLKTSPSRLWEIPAGDPSTGETTQAGEFAESPLAPYLDAIDRRAQALAAITRTPKHYFFNQGGAPSGEALITMESPLIKRANRFIERAQWTMERFGAWLLELDGYAVDPSHVRAVYADPRTVQPHTQAQTRQANVSAGIPLRTQLRREGWSEAELEQLDEDRATEAAAAQASLGAALMGAQRQFDGGES